MIMKYPSLQPRTVVCHPLPQAQLFGLRSSQIIVLIDELEV
jgi:hypothetical protein